MYKQDVMLIVFIAFIICSLNVAGFINILISLGLIHIVITLYGIHAVVKKVARKIIDPETGEVMDKFRHELKH